MSRVGSKEINIPESVKIHMQDESISAEGPMGQLKTKIHDGIQIDIEGSIIKVKPKSDDKSCLLYTSDAADE